MRPPSTGWMDFDVDVLALHVRVRARSIVTDRVRVSVVRACVHDVLPHASTVVQSSTVVRAKCAK